VNFGKFECELVVWLHYNNIILARLMWAISQKKVTNDNTRLQTNKITYNMMMMMMMMMIMMMMILAYGLRQQQLALALYLKTNVSTNRPSSSVSRHITVDLDRLL